MKKQINSWEEVYQLPFHLDKYGPYVWSKNGTMSLMFDSNVKQEDREKIIDSINKTSRYVMNGDLTIKDSDFHFKGQYIFCVRGWGHLTGIGALNLPESKAANIQDGFIEYVRMRLTCERCAGFGIDINKEPKIPPHQCLNCQQ